MPRIYDNQLQFRRAFVVIFLIGIFLRFFGLYPGYPPDHPDEPVLTVAYDMWRYKQFDPSYFGYYRFQYPGFLPYVNMLFMAGFFFPVTALSDFVVQPSALWRSLVPLKPDIFDIVVSGQMIQPLVWSRIMAAGFGSLAIPLVYLIGEKLFFPYIGLIASLLLAVNYRHITSSQLSLPDAPNSTFALLSLYLSLLIIKKQDWKRYIGAAVGVGLSLAVKLHVFSLLIFFFAHALASLKKKNMQEKIQFFISRLFECGIIIVVVFLFFNPFLPNHIPQAFQIQRLNGLRYGFGSYYLIWYPFWYLFTIGFGMLPSFFLGIGILYILFKPKYWVETCFLLLSIVPPIWSLTYYSHGGLYSRNFTSVIPFMTIIGAVGMWQTFHMVLQLFRRMSVSTFLVIFFVAVLGAGFPQLRDSVIHDYFTSHAWNRTCITSSLERYLQTGDKVAKTGAVPPVRDGKVIYVPQTNNVGYRTAFSLRELQEDNIKYFVVNYNESWGNFFSTVFSNITFKGLPLDILDNQFEGLALKELSRYAIFGCYKPWQSLDNNFAIIKIPEMKTISNLTPVVTKTINKQILYTSVNPWPVRQVYTEPIAIRGGQTYIIKGSVRPLQYIDLKKREGFFRIDFYGDIKAARSEHRGLLSAVSSRVYGKESVEKTVVQTAPFDSHYMTVSFQDDDRYTDFYMEKISIYTSDDQMPDEQREALKRPEIDNTVVYPQFIF